MFANLTDTWGYNGTTGLLTSDTAGDGGATTISAAASVGLSGPVGSSPAVANGRIFVRDGAGLSCIGKK